ncbi:MAG: GNAT family N-acetyltransferase [Anaerolineae bacterium]|nr:GNAT family N-acetyltransferase [Anaerolineae bacterium]
MDIIDTERLRLLPLTHTQLKLSRTNPDHIAHELNLTLDPTLFIDVVIMRAIKIKIERMEHISEHLHNWYTYWLIVIRANNTGVGLIGFKGEPGIQGKYDHIGEVEISYGIAPAHRCQGYTTEAARALIAWGFNDPDCHAVIAAEVLKSNRPSQRVLQKLGMRLYSETEETQCWRIDKA